MALPMRGCLWLAAACLGAAPAARARARLRGPANASSALALNDRPLPAPTSRALDGCRRLSGDYAEVAKLTASDAATDDEFGGSVAIDGDTVVVRASGSGSVYVFRTSDGGATYSHVAKLTASDAAAYDSFGGSVAIAGDTVVVGAYGDDDGGYLSGSVYVFRTTDGGVTYDQVAKLTAADAGASDRFGGSVAIDGATVVVGATGDADGGSDSGSVYIFRTSDDGATYGQVAKLTAADAARDDRFGTSVAIDGATVVVGAYGDDDGGLSSGSVYVFRTTDGGATYGQVVKLTAADAAAGDTFGQSVAMDGGTVVVGATKAGTGGAVYFFRTTDGGATYDQVAKIIADDAAASDKFGFSVAIDGDRVVVGATSAGTGGAVYVFPDERRRDHLRPGGEADGRRCRE